MTRLEKLKELETKLEAALKESDSRSIAAIAKQYRETIREIEEIEGIDETDEISQILSGIGEPGADSQDRTKLQSKRRSKGGKAAAGRGIDA